MSLIFFYKSLFNPYYGKISLSKEEFLNKFMEEYSKYKNTEKEVIENILNLIELDNEETKVMLRLKIKSLISVNNLKDLVSENDDVLRIGFNIEIADSKEKLSEIKVYEESSEGSDENPENPID